MRLVLLFWPFRIILGVIVVVGLVSEISPWFLYFRRSSPVTMLNRFADPSRFLYFLNNFFILWRFCAVSTRWSCVM